jgi:hypothetical protein
MKLNYTMKLFSSVAAVLLLSACGDSGDSSTSEGTAPALDPVVAYSVEKTSEYAGRVATMKLGTDGDFKAVSGSEDYPELGMSDSADLPYTINTVTKVESYGYSDSEDTISAITTSDYSAGTEHIKGTSKVHGDIDCTNTYQSPLPLVINDAAAFDEVYFDDEQRINTTCPSWMDETSPEEDDDYDYEEIENMTINGNSHISRYYSIK